MTRSRRVLPVLALLLLSLAVSAASYAVSDCYYAGVHFSDGAVACQAGQQYRCDNGDWDPVDLSCVNPPPAPTVENPQACSCTADELTACDQARQGCCVSLDAGRCIKKCCPK